MSAIELAMPGTPQWHKQRLSGVGASETAVALGRCPHKPAWLLWSQKRGECPPDDETDIMAFGNIMEPSVVRFWEHQTERTIARYPVPLLQDAERPWILATPDAEIDETTALEIKTTEEFPAQALGPEGTDEVHENWIWQAQMQCHVGGYNRVEFAVLVGRSLRHYYVKRNQRLIDHAIEGVTEFWERVQSGDPPPLDYAHRAAVDALKAVYGTVENEERVELPAELAALQGEYDRLSEEIKQAEEDRQIIRAKQLEVIGNAKAGVLPGGEYELRRIAISASEYVVKRKAGIQVRKCKVPQDAVVLKPLESAAGI